MYRIIGTRCTGKTSRLMLIAKENNAIFVCSNPAAMETKARAYGIAGLEFISYENFAEGLRGYQNNVPVVIDDLDTYISYIVKATCNGKLIGYTISEDEN